MRVALRRLDHMTSHGQPDEFAPGIGRRLARETSMPLMQQVWRTVVRRSFAIGVRQTAFLLLNGGRERRETCDNMVRAMDHTNFLWCTDCRSLSNHMTNPPMAEVSDKRLAIDLISFRQDLWVSE